MTLTDDEQEQHCRREQISHEHYTRETVERILAARLAHARANVLREHADREVAHEGFTMAVERLLAHAAEHDGENRTPPETP